MRIHLAKKQIAEISRASPLAVGSALPSLNSTNVSGFFNKGTKCDQCERSRDCLKQKRRGGKLLTPVSIDQIFGVVHVAADAIFTTFLGKLAVLLIVPFAEVHWILLCILLELPESRLTEVYIAHIC